MFEQMSPSQEKNLDIIEKKFPRIANMIRIFWGTAEGKEYLESLIVDRRGGRTGFPLEVMLALMELESEYKVLPGSGKLPPKKDAWENSADSSDKYNED